MNAPESRQQYRRDYGRKKAMRQLYQRAERGELDAEKTTERTAAALLKRNETWPSFNPAKKILDDLIAAGFEQCLILECM